MYSLLPLYQPILYPSHTTLSLSHPTLFHHPLTPLSNPTLSPSLTSLLYSTLPTISTHSLSSHSFNHSPYYLNPLSLTLTTLSTNSPYYFNWLSLSPPSFNQLSLLFRPTFSHSHPTLSTNSPYTLILLFHPCPTLSTHSLPILSPNYFLNLQPYSPYIPMQNSYHILPLSLSLLFFILLPLLSDFLWLLYFTPNSHYSFTPISLRIFHPFFASISNITLPLSTLSLILLPYSLPFSTHTLSSLSFTPHSYLAQSLPSFRISPLSHSTISPHYLTQVFYPTLQFLSLALWTHPSNSSLSILSPHSIFPLTPLYPIISPTFSLSLFSHPTPLDILAPPSYPTCFILLSLLFQNALSLSPHRDGSVYL